MSRKKYNSFDEFLQDHGTSLDELINESRLSRAEVYQTYMFPLETESRFVRLGEYFAENKGIRIANIINRSMIWSKTTKGQRFWDKTHASWKTYVESARDVAEINEMFIFSKALAFDINDIQDKICGGNPSIENI